MQTPMESAARGFYARQATGLVREFGLGTSILLNFTFLALPFGLFFITIGPFAFPGANLILALVATGVLCVVIAVLYGWVSVIMPRSGGLYVFASRTLLPSVGFAASLNLILWLLLSSATYGASLVAYGISPALASLGQTLNNHWLVSAGNAVLDKGWQFGIVAAVLLFSMGLVSLSPRAWPRLFVPLALFSFVGPALLILLMLLHGRDDFQAALQSVGVNYGKLISTAEKAGYTPTGFSVSDTYFAMALAFSGFAWTFMIPSMAGEIRSPAKTAVKAAIGGMAIVFVIIFLTTVLSLRTFGQEFLGAATYLGTVAPDKYPFVAPPFITTFGLVLTNNPFLIALIGLSFVMAFVVGLPPTFLIVSRSVFAWSFDRVMPDKLAEVEDRTHQPLIANAVILVVTLIFLAVYYFGPATFVQLLYSGVAAEILTFIAVAVGAAIFPWRRRALYNRSSITGKVLGAPTIAVIGLISTIIFVALLVPYLTNNALGANSTTGLIAIVTIGLIGFPIYGLSYFLNRRRGVDLGTAFHELPPE